MVEDAYQRRAAAQLADEGRAGQWIRFGPIDEFGAQHQVPRGVVPVRGERDRVQQGIAAGRHLRREDQVVRGGRAVVTEGRMPEPPARGDGRGRPSDLPARFGRGTGQPVE